MSLCFRWLGFIVPHLEKRLQILSPSPFLDNSSHSVPSEVVVIKYVLMTLKTLTGILLLKDPKWETMVLFSALRGFLPECHTSPVSVVVKKGRCTWPAGAGGLLSPTVLLALLFPLGSPPVLCTEVGWEYPWVRNFTWACSPLPPLTTHQKDPKLL